MHPIEMLPPTPPFLAALDAAGAHLQERLDLEAGKAEAAYPPGGLPGGVGIWTRWLKTVAAPPWLEHVSFRLGNQVFFVRVEGNAGRLPVPGRRAGVRAIAEGWHGHACLMPLHESRGRWIPDLDGWGLLDLVAGERIDPPSVVTDAWIEMTDWELHACAVQMLREALEAEGTEILSWQESPHVDPSLWFVGDDGPEWVVVRAARWPERRAAPPPPAKWAELGARCARLGRRGHFASVGLGGKDLLDPDAPPGPPWRGGPMHVEGKGLELRWPPGER